FRGSPFVVALSFVRRHRCNLFATRIAVYDWHMAEFSALIPYLGGVIGRIHEVVAVGYLAAGQFHQRNGNLAVMHGGRSQYGTQGETAVVHINMQFEAIPGFCVTLGVLPDTTVTDCRKQSYGFLRRLVTLNIQSLRFSRL